MTAFTFDAIEHLKRLKQDGFSEAQAEAVIRVVRDVQETNLSFITTKADIQELRAETKTDIEKLDNKIDSGKAELKTDIKKLDSKIDAVKAELKANIRELELTLKAEMKADKADVIKWMFGGFISVAGLVMAVLGVGVSILLKLH